MLSGSTGMTTVSGAGSKWTAAHLDIGGSGQGTLFVADGGQVTTQAMSINSQSAVGLHVSGNNMLVLGNASAAGSMRNYGTMSFYADPLLPAGTYRPISEYAGRSIIWSGPGSYKAVGGTWSSTTKTFTVLAPTSLSAGQSNTLTTGKRLLFTDSLTGHRVGASFGTITGTMNFSAAPMSATDLADLDRKSVV